MVTFEYGPENIPSGFEPGFEPRLADDEESLGTGVEKKREKVVRHALAREPVAAPVRECPLTVRVLAPALV